MVMISRFGVTGILGHFIILSCNPVCFTYFVVGAAVVAFETGRGDLFEACTI